MICALCKNDLKPIKTHAIPEAFFRELRDDWKAPILMTNKEGHYPKKSPIGVYDDEILCEPCEQLFDKWDNYGINILLKQRDKYFEIKDKKNKVIALRLDSYEYKKLKLFFVSVLWRASISKHVFYSKVKLGPHESIAKKMIVNDNPGHEEIFSVVLSNFVSKAGKERIVGTLMDPFPERWGNGVKAYRMYFGRICAYIKVDKQRYPEWMRKLTIKPSKPLYVINRTLETSNDFKAMVAVVKNAKR